MVHEAFLYKCGPYSMQDTPGWHHCQGGTFTTMAAPEAAIELLLLDGWSSTLADAIAARDGLVTPPAPAPAPEVPQVYRGPGRPRKS